MSTELISTGVKFPDGTIQTTRASSGAGTVTGVTGTAPISSSGGTAPVITIAAATTGAAGSMSAADKQKLDGIAANATANAGTVTGVTGTAPIVSSGGTAPVISIAAATTSAAGSMSAADKVKLNGLSSGGGLITYPSVTGKTWISLSCIFSSGANLVKRIAIATDGTTYIAEGYSTGWVAGIPNGNGGLANLPTGKTWIGISSSYDTSYGTRLVAIATDGTTYIAEGYSTGWVAGIPNGNGGLANLP